MNLNFYKLTAAGNDFVLIDNRENIVPENMHSKLAAKLCDRRYSMSSGTYLYCVTKGP